MVTTDDFFRFDYILAMDRANLSRLQRLRPATSRADVRLLLAFAEDCAIEEVPDPYYGGPSGFEQVLDLVQQGSMGLLAHLCCEQGITLQFPDYPRAKKPARS